MARRRNYGQFTPRRRAALKRAAIISAQKRHARRKRIAVGVLAVGGLGAAAYLGHKNHDRVNTATKNARAVVAPLRKEAIIKANAIGGNLITRGYRKTAPVVPGKGRSIKRGGLKRIELAPVDPAKVRAKDTPYRAPGSHQRINEDTLEIVDRTDKYLPRELVKGRKVKDTTIRKALNKDAKAKGRSGVKAGQSQHTTLAGQNSVIDRMVADGTVRRTVAGKKIARGVHPQVAAAQAKQIRKNARSRRIKRGATASGMTEAEIRAALGFAQ